MGDQVEGTCPLCMQEMDLTDQHLKPCKCGYQICVWCWHHIIEMAEKDGTEGRCPACRSPYDKERIMAMTISRERLSELKSVNKQKFLKEKSKTSYPSEDFSTLRVIRRNLVYIAGIPVKFADEKILRKREFLGQYGKVSRIVITQAPGGNLNFSSSSYCCVFVTFSTVEEALRCIQVVNGYTLAGQPLKACFGATRYCQAWLKNLPCRNPNCIYLHNPGSQEDTCTKDEVYTACVSKLQQYSGISLNNFQQRSGSCLPPPVDSIYNSTTTSKPLVQSGAYKSLGDRTNSHSNGDGGKSGLLPVATSWSSKVTSRKPSYASIAVSTGPSSHRSIQSVLSSAVVEAHIPAKPCVQNSRQITMSIDKIPVSQGQTERLAPSKPYDQNGYPKKPGLQDFNAGVETDIVKEDTLSEPCLVPHNDNVSRINILATKSDSNENKQLTSISSFSDSPMCSRQDKIKQVSLGILSGINRSNLDGECLDKNTNVCLSTTEYSNTPSVHFSNLDSRTVGSRLENSMGSDFDVFDSWEDGIISDKASADSREDIVSDILSLIGLDDHLADPHSQTRPFNDTNKQGAYDHSRMREQALPLGTDGSGLKKDSKLPDIVEKNACTDKPFVGFNSFALGNSVLRSNCVSTTKADDGSGLLSNLCQSASPIPGLEVSTALRNAPQSIALSKPPPGFPPRQPADHRKLSCMPSSFGSSVQSQFSGGASHQNSRETIARNSHYSEFPTIREKILQSTDHRISSNCSSNLVASSDINHCLEFQNSRKPIDQNKMKNIAIQEPMRNYHQLMGDHVDSSYARESGIVGRTDLMEITNSGSVSFSNSRFGFLIPSPKHDEPKLQLPNSGCFYSTWHQQC